VTSGAAPLTVHFTFLGTGNIIDRAWDFDNDGITDSTEENPSYTYQAPGNYTVSLEVTGPHGSDTETKTDYIHVQEAQDGVLPIFNLGDEWVYRWVEDFAEMTFTQRVTGEEMVDSKDCYAMDWIYEPPMPGMDSVKYWVDKLTQSFSKMQGTSEYDSQVYVWTTIYSYEIVEGSYWPLVVGNEFRMEGTETTTVTMNDEVLSEDTMEVTYLGRVETEEEIEVPAGTFDCFKMVMTDEDENLLYLGWYSDQVKSQVKSISYDEGGSVIYTMELESYSVLDGI